MHKLLVGIAFILMACQGQNLNTSEATEKMLEFGTTNTLTLSAGNNNDLVVPFSSSTIVELTPNASGSVITGIKADAEQDGSGNYLGQGVTSGQTLLFRNVSSTTSIVFAHESTSSTTNYRMRCPRGDFTLEPGRVIWVEYTTDSDWLLLTPDTTWDGPTSESAPSHALGTAWHNTLGRPVLGMYSVRVTTSITLTTGQAGHVELAYGTSSGSQATVCGRVGSGDTGTLVVGANLTSFSEGELSCIIPAGDWAILRKTDETGTPTYSITNQIEQVL